MDADILGCGCFSRLHVPPATAGDFRGSRQSPQSMGMLLPAELPCDEIDKKLVRTTTRENWIFSVRLTPCKRSGVQW